MAKQSASEQLLRVFERKNSDGTPYFSNEDIANALPFLVFFLLPSEVIATSLSPDMQQFIAEFAASIGVQDSMNQDEISNLVQQHYQENPINTDIITELGKVAKQLIADNQGFELNPLAKEILGDSKPMTQLSEEQKKSRNFLNQMLLQNPTKR